jgi:hypothetical protein
LKKRAKKLSRTSRRQAGMAARRCSKCGRE